MFSRILFPFVTGAFAVHAQVVISQIYGGGGNQGAPLSHDFVELFNAGPEKVNLNGYSLQHAATQGTSWNHFNLSGEIESGGFLLIRAGTGQSNTGSTYPYDLSTGLALSAEAAKIAIVRRQTVLPAGTVCPSTDVLDLVGYGTTTNCSKGRPVSPNLNNSTAAIRISLCTPSTDNSRDFRVGAPSPRSSRSQRQPCQVAPPPITPPSISILTTSVTNAWLAEPYEAQLSSANGVAPVRWRVSQGELPSGFELQPDGWIRGSTLALGSRTFQVEARDAAGVTATRTLSLTASARPCQVSFRIPDLRTQNQRSATTNGVVTKMHENGFFLQVASDPAPGQYGQGIFVQIENAANWVRPGALLCVSGTTYPSSTPSMQARQVTLLNPDVALPAAVRLNPDTLPREKAAEILSTATGMRTVVGPLVVTGPSEDGDGRYWVQLANWGRAFLRPGVDVAAGLTGELPRRLLQTPQSPERIAVLRSGLQIDAGAGIDSVRGVLTRSAAGFELLAESIGSIADAPAANWPRAAEEGETVFGHLRLAGDGSRSVVLARKLELAMEGPLRMPHLLVLSTTAASMDSAAFEGIPAKFGSYEVRATLSTTSVVLVDSRKIPRFEPVELGSEAKVFVSPEGLESPLFASLPWFADLESQGVTVVFAEFAAQNEYGRRVKQAEYVARSIEELQNQGRKVLILGEFGAPEFNDGWVDVTGTLRGQPAAGDEVLFGTSDFITTDLVNLTETMAPELRYTHVVNGLAQALTHGLVSQALLDRVSYGVARIGADFRSSYRMDPDRAEGVSKHDVPLVYLR